MSNCVVNVGRLMRENAVIDGIRFRVSPDAVNEWVSRVVDRIIDFTPELCRIAKEDSRKTIMEQDVVAFFSIVGRDVL